MLTPSNPFLPAAPTHHTRSCMLALLSRSDSGITSLRIRIFYTGYGKANTTLCNALVAVYLGKFVTEINEYSKGACTLIIGRPDFRVELRGQDATGVYCCCHERVSDVVRAVCAEQHIPFFKETLADRTLAEFFGWCGV